MAIIQALHGRRRMQWAASRRCKLIALLILVPIGLRALEAEVVHIVRLASPWTVFSGTAKTIFSIATFNQCLSYLLAGLAFDRFGVKRTIAVVLLVWAALVTLGAIGLYPVTYRVLSPILTVMLPGFGLTAVLVSVRLAWPARRRAVVVAVLLLAEQYALQGGLLVPLFPRPSAQVPASWQFPMLACVTLGTVVFALWTFTFQDVDRGSGLDLRPHFLKRAGMWRSIMADEGVWIILAIQFCAGLVWRESELLRWNFETLDKGGLTMSATLIAVAPATAFLAAAWLSDRAYRRRREWVVGRKPLVFSGFVTAGLVPIVTGLAAQDSPALQIVDLCALNVLRVADLLVIDCAPRRLAGRYIGFVLMGEALSSFYVRPPLERFAKEWPSGVITLAAIAALVGAGLAVWLLPRLRPVAD